MRLWSSGFDRPSALNRDPADATNCAPNAVITAPQRTSPGVRQRNTGAEKPKPGSNKLTGRDVDAAVEARNDCRFLGSPAQARCRQRFARTLSSSRCAVVIALLCSCFVVFAPQTAHAAPNYVNLTFYMRNQTPNSAIQRGCELGAVAAGTPGSQLMHPILLFGGPRVSGSTMKASNWQHVDYTLAHVQAQAYGFAQGFFYCSASSGDVTSTLSLVVASSSDGQMVSGDNVRIHGEQWGSMVNALHTQLRTQGWGSRAWALAGTNVEPGFAWNPTQSRLWINRARNNNSPRPFISNPTAFCNPEGTYTAATDCEYVWTAEDIASVSYFNSTPIIRPIPQIYGSSYVERWYRLSKCSAGTSRGKFAFRGVMTQWRACQQDPDDSCPTNHPTTGFDALQTKINSDAATAFVIPLTMLDVRWADLSNTGAAP